jgi:hypothetical protein
MRSALEEAASTDRRAASRRNACTVLHVVRARCRVAPHSMHLDRGVPSQAMGASSDATNPRDDASDHSSDARDD